MLFSLIFFAVAISSSAALDCTQHITFWQDQDRGEVFHLMDHHLLCPAGSIMQEHKMVLNSGAYRYEYTCCKAEIEDSKCHDFCTGYVDFDSCKDHSYHCAWMIALHDISCPPGEMLKAFKYDANWGDGTWRDRFRYYYSCCPVANSFYCSSHETSPQGHWEDKLMTLSFHDVACPVTSAMRKWQLALMPGGDNYYMKYECCEVPYVPCNDPIDEYVVIMECEGSLKCSYTKKIGVSKTRSTSQGGSQTVAITQEITVGLEKVFANKIGISIQTGHNWSMQSSEAFSEETTISEAFECVPGKSCQLQQVIGHCGGFKVSSSKFRLVDSKTGNVMRIAPRV